MRDAPHLYSAARLGQESVDSTELNEPELGKPGSCAGVVAASGLVHQMITMKTLSLAVGIALAASSLAVAQQGNPENNAAASGGSGTHQTAPKTGSAANTQKVIGNQQGYQNQQGSKHVAGRERTRTSAHSRRHIVAFVPTHRCRMLMREGRPVAKSCRRM